MGLESSSELIKTLRRRSHPGPKKKSSKGKTRNHKGRNLYNDTG